MANNPPPNYIFQNVVYGYAFREHWVWINKMRMMGSGSDYSAYSVILWKDFNCHTWVTHSSWDLKYPTSTKKTALEGIIQGLATSNTTFYTDPWLFAYTSVGLVQKSYPEEAYSIVLLPEGGDYFSRVCVFNDTNAAGEQIVDNKGLFTDSPYLRYILMRMR